MPANMHCDARNDRIKMRESASVVCESVSTIERALEDMRAYPEQADGVGRDGTRCQPSSRPVNGISATSAMSASRHGSSRHATKRA